MAANIHPTAQVAPGAELGDGVEVGAYAVQELVGYAFMPFHIESSECDDKE